MKFSIGDTVSFLNTIGQGTVKGYTNDLVIVEDENGFDDHYPEHELVIRNYFKVEGVELKDQNIQTTRTSLPRQASLLEKDLHFNQLVEYPKNYSSHAKLEIQLSHARNFLAQAKRGGNKRVVLIHGVGEGRLKEEIHTLLERMNDLRFYDASYADYGKGATEVEFY